MKINSLPLLFVRLFALLWFVSPVTWATDNQWTYSGLQGYSVNALVIDTRNPATLYVGASNEGYGSGVFKSNDAGKSWNAANKGLINTIGKVPSVYKIVIDLFNPDTLYAGTDAGIYKSTDGGGSWHPVSPEVYVNILTITSSNPSTLYGTTSDSWAYKSSNGGGSWSQTTVYNPSYFGMSFGVPLIYGMTINPSNPTMLYLGIGGAYAGIVPGWGGILKSTDGGGSWHITGPNDTVTTLAIVASNPSTIYAGVGFITTGGSLYKSTDGGENWSLLNARLGVNTLVIDPYNPTTLYAGAANGVYKSIDGGVNWSYFNTGLLGQSINALAIDPSNSATLYVGTTYGVSKLTSAKSTISPIDCLFNWAEKNYPALFAPAGSSTVVWNIYKYRYYSATNTYLGLALTDYHVYYMGPDGILQDEGPASYWLPLAGCQ